MADRKKTPDIMSDLLGGSSSEPTIKPVDHNTGIPAYQPTIKPARQKRSAPVKKGKAPEEAPKVKATFYISSDIVDKLEQGWSELRKITPKDQRGEVSKSLIVEAGLQEVLEDLAKKSKDSLLAKKISQMAKK